MTDVPTREPEPRFEPRPDDPAWLVASVRLHGHLGPWAVLGARVGQAVLADLDCKGYFDVRIEVSGPIAKPPPRCIVDGLQFATGATLGKGNISAALAETFEIRATNTKTDQTVRYQLTEQVLADISDLSGHDQVEALARTLAIRPLEQIAIRCV